MSRFGPPAPPASAIKKIMLDFALMAIMLCAGIGLWTVFDFLVRHVSIAIR